MQRAMRDEESADDEKDIDGKSPIVIIVEKERGFVGSRQVKRVGKDHQQCREQPNEVEIVYSRRERLCNSHYMPRLVRSQLVRLGA